jgi:hypothetical protein
MELPCCQLTAAPLPDASIGSGKISVAPSVAALRNALQAITVRTIEPAPAQTELEQFASPPDRQPLLCTFLI